MIHILLFIHMLVIVVSVWTISYIHHIQKIRNERFLRDYFHHILFFILSVVAYQIFEYVYVNLFGYDFTQLPSHYRLIVYPLAMTAEFGMATTLLRMLSVMRGIKESKLNRMFLIVGLILIGIGYLIGVTRFAATGSFLWMSAVFRVLFLSIYGVLLIVLVRFCVDKTSGQRLPSFRPFCILYLSRYGLWLIMLLFPYPSRLVIHTALLLMTSLIPVFWMRRFHLRHPAGNPFSEDHPILSTLFQQYRLTSREREIVKLIVAGKSNKEIEGALFISFNTVKNHIYRLYQKLGIQSRGQLMSLIVGMQERK